MPEMIEEFMPFVINEIRDNVKGFVKYFLDGDTLIVKIISPKGEDFCYFEDDLSFKILNGLQATVLAQAVIKRYRIFVTSFYFKENTYGKNKHF